MPLLSFSTQSGLRASVCPKQVSFYFQNLHCHLLLDLLRHNFTVSVPLLVVLLEAAVIKCVSSNYCIRALASYKSREQPLMPNSQSFRPSAAAIRSFPHRLLQDRRLIKNLSSKIKNEQDDVIESCHLGVLWQNS